MLAITYLFKNSEGPEAPIYCSMKTLSKSRQLVMTPKYMYTVQNKFMEFFPASDEKDICQGHKRKNYEKCVNTNFWDKQDLLY
jgi:hypothetical protein